MKLSSLYESPLKVPYQDPNASGILTNRLTVLLNGLSGNQRIIVVCVGTDRSTGDSLGPLIGTTLSNYRSSHFELYGTLEEPVHAMNLEDTLGQIHRKHPHSFVIGIDACLGQVTSVGSIQVGIGPVRPGAGVNKQLPPVGDMHITGIVNVGGFMEYFVLQNTRLHLVMRMADVIAHSLFSAIMHCRSSRPAAMQE